MDEVKQYFRDEGIEVPVTYGDVYGVFVEHPQRPLCLLIS